MTVLFTDTSANLPKEICEKNNIRVIPYSYFYEGSDQNLALSDFDGKLFYDQMRAGSVVNTSMINLGTFESFFEQALKEENDVLYLGMSSGLSGSMHMAQTAAHELRERFPERSIEIVDTLAASLGEGFLVLDAVMYLERGLSAAEVAEKIRRRSSSMLCQFLTVDNINYLKRTGRVSGPVAFIGSLLNIRPLLRGNSHGKIVMYGKVRGAKAALTALAERYDSMVIDRSAPVGVAHADNPQAAAELFEMLRQRGFTGKSMTVYYEPVTGSHVGPGTVALFFYGNKKNML